MKVKTDCTYSKYITADKVYDVVMDSDGDPNIIDDEGDVICICIDEDEDCAHISPARWEVVK